MQQYTNHTDYHFRQAIEKQEEIFYILLSIPPKRRIAK